MQSEAAPAQSPTAAAPDDGKQRQSGPNPKRKYKKLPPEDQRFSSAKAYESPYSADDYGPDGKLRRIKNIPLGTYPAAVADQIRSFKSSDFDAPPAPIAPPLVKQQLEVAKAGQRAMAAAGKEVLLSNEDEEITIEQAPLVHRTLVERGAPAQRVAMEQMPEPRRTAEGQYDGSDPAEFRDPQQHYIAVVSWIVNRHPQEDAILEHRFRQYVAEKEGRYNPHEDPPVDLRQITPLVYCRVTRTFSRREAEYNNGEAVATFAQKLHAASEHWNVITLECGQPQALPVSDAVRGIYKDPALNQQMTAFYDSQKRGHEDILARIKRDKEEAERAHRESLQATEKLRSDPEAAKDEETPPPPPVNFDEQNERQREMRRAAGAKVQTTVQPVVKRAGVRRPAPAK